MSNLKNPIATPPGTTLSTPSPTELSSINPLSVDDMPPSPSASSLRNIYLIVATTPVNTPSGPRLGIGLKGSLPWPMIKPDMTYFRKVTTHGREQTSSQSSDSSLKYLNSVFMGRKTYESIPTKFRPLSNRRNLIVTRSDVDALAERYRKELSSQYPDLSGTSKYGEKVKSEFTLMMSATPLPKLERVMTVLPNPDSDPFVPVTIAPSVPAAIDATEWSPFINTPYEAGLLICIGGAEIYKLCLEDEELRPRLRILQTDIRKLEEGEEFECDTFWPEVLDGYADGGGRDMENGNGWREVSVSETKEWTGIDVPQGSEEWKVVEDVGVKLKVRGWVPR